MKTYTLNICGHDYESGLTAIEVVRRIYTHDRASFWLEPKMVEIEDKDGNSVSGGQEVFVGKLVWEVWFKDARGHVEKGNEAYGDTEEEAEEAYLLGCFEENRWADKFLVETDEEATANL